MSEKRPDTTPHRLLTVPAVPALYPTKHHADTKSHGCKRLEGKHAIVSASTRGIGFSIAQRLAEEGAQVCTAAAHHLPHHLQVMICSRRQRHVQQAVNQLREKGLRHRTAAPH